MLEKRTFQGALQCAKATQGKAEQSFLSSETAPFEHEVLDVLIATLPLKPAVSLPSISLIATSEIVSEVVY